MKWLLTVLCAALLSGCVNVYTRWPFTDAKIATTYQSTSMAASLALIGSFPQMMSDCPGTKFEVENVFLIIFWGLPCAVDAICEAAIDTVLWPCDKILTNQRNKGKETNQ